MNYYQVEAKCGHVGKSNYIIKKFYIRANSKKEAAYMVRYMPRVKHHHKDAIQNVIEISYEEYLLGRDDVENDLYFHVSNSSDQRLLCSFEESDIKKEEAPIRYKKATHTRKHLIELLTVKEWRSGRSYVYE